MAALGTGIAMSTTVITGLEFWFARGCFVLAGASAIAAYLLWYKRNSARGLGTKVSISILTALIVIIGTPLSLYWLGLREIMAMVGPRFEFQGITVKENDSEYVPIIRVGNTSEIPATAYALIGVIFVSDYKNDDQNKDVSFIVDKLEGWLISVTLSDNDQLQITRGMGIESPPLAPIGKKQKELVDSGSKQMFIVWATIYRSNQQVKDTMWVTEQCAQITKPFTEFQSCPAHNKYFLADQALKKLK